MTPRERSILIAGAAVVLALLGIGLGLQATGGSNNAGSDVAADLTQPSVLAPRAQARSDTGEGSESSTTPLTETSSTLPPTTPVSTVVETTTEQVTSSETTAPPTTIESTTTTALSTTIAVPTSSTSEPTTASTSSSTTVASTTTVVPSSTTIEAAGGLNAVEREVFRLTNALRAEPAGPLARQKPLPSCVDERFYGITVGGSGHPDPAAALTLSEPVSLQMARAWSIEMDRTGNFSHRPNQSAAAVYAELGINWSATGENIAWFRGYPDSQAAQIFFEGWRESDTGHYCAMVSPTYSHIGVGYFKGASSSWATQNFYRPS